MLFLILQHCYSSLQLQGTQQGQLRGGREPKSSLLTLSSIQQVTFLDIKDPGFRTVYSVAVTLSLGV